MFDDSFFEADWCENGHFGYVIEGHMTIDFNGKQASYTKGDVLIIPAGKNHKHKAHIKEGNFVELILFESL